MIVLLDAVASVGRHAGRLAWALTAIAGAWFIARLVQPIGPVVLGWLPALLCSALAAAVCYRISRRAATPRAVARFWAAIAVGTAFVGVATLVRSLHSIGPDADVHRVAAPEMVLYLAAVAADGWALFRLPLGVSGPRQRWQFTLDASTILVSTALFFWYLTVRPVLGEDNERAMLTGLAASALTVVLVLAVVKAALTGSATIDSGALRALGVALLAGALGSAPEALLPAAGPSTGQLVVPVACLLAIIGARRQDRAATVRQAVKRRTRRPFSVLPYTAVAASSALLLYTAVAAEQSDRVIVAVALVLLVALVVSRQVLAFADNAGLTRDLAARERRFRSLVRNSSDFITITDAQGRFTYVSPGVHRVLGLDHEAWIGRLASDLIHPADLDTVRERYATIKDLDGASVAYETRLRHADGTLRWIEISNTNLLHDPAVAGTVGNARDITEERAIRQQLEHQAHHDALTGLANRTMFHQLVRQALAEPTSHVAVVLVDLNDFKIVNDTLGHSAGDLLLETVAHRLTSAIRAHDTVARLGGDEFAILRPDVTSDDADALAQTTLAALATPARIAGYSTRMTASVGVAIGDGTTTAEELLRRADIAMYSAKADRTDADNRWARYTPALDVPVMDRMTFESELRDSIEQGRLRLLYQPIVTVDSRRIAAVEALVRWEHPDRGMLAPAQFLPVAERSDLILYLGRWVLNEACRQAAQWRADLGTLAPTISVNVSARQLHDSEFADHVAATLARTGLPAHQLTIEITETAALHPHSVDVLHTLHGLGVRISLDDFGTGHSSLSLLQSCPAHEVKLDRSFTRTAITAGHRSVAVAVIKLADALGLDVVAEGVETAEQAAHLAGIGYHHLQGYHFSQPCSAQELDEQLDQHRPLPSTAPTSCAVAA